MKKVSVILIVVLLFSVAANADLMLRLHADDYDGTTTWTDTSGMGNDATVVLGDPLAGTFGGNPVVEFDGGDAFQISSPIGVLSDADGYTILAYMSAYDGGGSSNGIGGSVICPTDSGGFHWEIYSNYNTTNSYNTAGLGSNNTLLNADQFYMSTVQVNDAGGIFRLDGAPDGTMSGLACSTLNPLEWIGSLNPLSYPEIYTLFGKIVEIRVYNTQLTEAEMTAVEGQMETGTPPLIAATIDEGDGVSVSEDGGTDSYTIVLTEAPTANVTISVSPNVDPNLPQVLVTGAPVVFTSSNWATPKTVTVEAIDDSVREANPHSVKLLHGISSADPTFDSGIVPGVTVSITENDLYTLALQLKAEDYNEITGIWTDISGRNNHATGASSDPNASGPSYVTGQTQNGSDAVRFEAGDFLTLTNPIQAISGADGYTVFAYLKETADKWSTIISADTGGMQWSIGTDGAYLGAQYVVRSNQALLYGGSASIPSNAFSCISLKTNDAESTFRFNQTPDAATGPGSAYSGGLNWIGIHPGMVEEFVGDIVEIRVYIVQLSAAEIDAIEAEIIAENLSPVVTLDDGGDGLYVIEGDTATDSYSVVLNSTPSSPVTITVNADLSQVTVTGSPMVFTAAGALQTITVEAVDDAVAENDPHTVSITHTIESADPEFDAFPLGLVNVTIGENDCGAMPYADEDINEDCEVNFEDFALLAAKWLDCSISDCN